MYIEVTKYAELKERRMISHNASEGFYSPEICLVALGQGFLRPEANIAAHNVDSVLSKPNGAYVQSI
jgi:hypothetical protein